jgi:hypothetical protein
MSWMLRKRKPSEQVSGSNVRIRSGEFGSGSPAYAFETDGRPSAGIYSYHEGDLFSPGSGNWVFEPNFELPLITVWGKGFIRNPNTFNPYQMPQIWSQPRVVQNGLGGPIAGDVMLQGLINPENQTSGFVGDFAE